LNPGPVRIAGLGIVSALGADARSTLEALRHGACGLKPLTQFRPAGHDPLPVGEALLAWGGHSGLPRTHCLARWAADQAMAGRNDPPDAIVIGTTTGGMALTEGLLLAGETDPAAFAWHPLASVAEDLARRFGCRGPVLTVSTACASGAAAIRLAQELLRRGMARRVLAGGVDSLCRLTYYGFKSLQLIDPAGARPMDADRRGMSLSEAAAVLLLDAAEDPAAVNVLGGGLSCDAFHPTRPHPQGDGALGAMQAALADAGLGPEAVDYLHLHGTGTLDNDQSEALAVKRLFKVPPPLSSIKGASGHSLAAAGAVGAVVAALCVANGVMPGNVGLTRVDPGLGLSPLPAAVLAPVGTVLSNAFGFGGNNAALVIGRGAGGTPGVSSVRAPLKIGGLAAVTGAGHTAATLDRLRRQVACRGRLEDGALCAGLAPGRIRRLKRLARMALALAAAARPNHWTRPPEGIFFGTAMGALSETHDFLNQLFTSAERFSSPTDFIGSVHNAPAGQLALKYGATGPNIAVTGGGDTFAQALLAAELLTGDGQTALLVAADENHPHMTARIDPRLAADPSESDGGGAFWLHRSPNSRDPAIHLLALVHSADEAAAAADLAERLPGCGGYGLILGAASRGPAMLSRFARCIDHGGPLVDYGPLVGEFGAAPAVAVVLAAALVRQRQPLAGGPPAPEAVLVVGLGSSSWALEVRAP
jgi:3-oxoacyl-(acyl-carrier-protein) synthase